MSNHNGAVTVVRFSPNGQYLASGSDDRIVLIWEKDDQRVPRQEFGSHGEADTEAWVARKRLIGHDNDVQDLAWSPDGSILVTVGLDSAIIIWSGSTFEKLKRFDAHQSHVKGITFDPANKYFATASDDRTVRIVRYHKASGSDMTFNIEATISVPFEGSPLSTYFRRCSWSPDGNHIAAANATNGPVATVAIINRGTWDSEISLIGHDAPCEVASFSPRVFTAEKPEDRPKEGEPNTITVIATAAQDKTLAVWNTTHPRPLVVAHNVAEKAITDIVWTADGRSLFASSLDGTILVATFEDGELGYPMSAEEVESQLSRYGGTKDTMQIPESVEQIALEEKLATNEPTATQAAATTTSASIATTTATTNTATTTTVAQNEATPSSAPVQSSRLEELLGPGESSHNGFNQLSHNLQPAPSASSTNNNESRPNAGNGKPAAQQKVTITKEGKKRVAPMLISSSSSSSTNKPPAAARAMPTAAESNIEVMEMSKPSYALPRGGVNSMIIGSKRKPDDDNVDGEIISTTNKKSKQEEVPEFIKPAVVCPASTVAQVRLATPKVRTFFSSPSASDTRSTALEVRNGSGNEQEPTRIIATKRGQVLFIDFLPRHGHLASGTGDLFWAVATEDGSIYIYSPNGRRLMPCIVLGSSLTFLESQGAYLLAITSTGMMHIWNITEQCAVHAPVSLAPILDNGTKYMENGVTRAPSVTQCGVTETGHAVLTLSNGAGFTYNSAMLSWHRISDSWWTFGSQYWDSSGRANASGGIIGMVERRTNDEVIVKGGNRGRQLQRMAKNRMMQEGYEGFEGIVSIAHLENRIGACIMLGSNREFEQFMLMYAEKLAEEGMTDRVDELCKQLLGPSVIDDKSQWDPQVCSINKHDLLRSIVQRIARYREVQRVVNDYAQLLDI
ncbi:hypothetical protein TRICI_006619 [Trichomonascus ciferrii]|uniref:Protein HIR n=1 Tax=Trichomonascus ciferrii TaxID=44093 RepID=A0A642UG40_9ASCO|nr:hypothetical protein TRICI_006619 [Trichomonascus ciferrii]